MSANDPIITGELVPSSTVQEEAPSKQRGVWNSERRSLWCRRRHAVRIYYNHYPCVTFHLEAPVPGPGCVPAVPSPPLRPDRWRAARCLPARAQLLMLARDRRSDTISMDPLSTARLKTYEGRRRRRRRIRRSSNLRRGMCQQAGRCVSVCVSV